MNSVEQLQRKKKYSEAGMEEEEAHVGLEPASTAEQDASKSTYSWPYYNGTDGNNDKGYLGSPTSTGSVDYDEGYLGSPTSTGSVDLKLLAGLSPDVQLAIVNDQHELSIQHEYQEHELTIHRETQGHEKGMYLMLC